MIRTTAFPRAELRCDVDVRPVPALRLTFVPIVQRFNKALTGNVSDANKEQFLGDARRMLPLLDIDAQVHAPYTTSDSLELTSNDGNSVWLHVLSEMNTLRVAESSQRNYFGVVKVSYNSGIAGYGYVPGRAAVGWDYLPSGRTSRRTSSRTTSVAFTPLWWRRRPGSELPVRRRHDRCVRLRSVDERAAAPDRRSISWVTAATRGSATTTTSARWSGARRMRRATRQVPRSGSRRMRRRTPSLLVWGHMERGQLVLEPAFSIVARPNVPREAGPYRIEGIARNGRTVFSYSFAGERPADVDDPTARHFAFAIPMDEATQGELASIRLTGPGAAATA